MERIDTSNWSIAVVACANGYKITYRILQGEDEVRQFCERYGYTFVSFQKGTHPYCK